MLAGTGVRTISSVACGFSPIKIDYSDYLKSSISRINEVYVVFLLKEKHRLHLSRLFYCNHTCYCVNMVSVTSASRYISQGRVAQSVTCLATDACLTADPGVASSIPVRSHTFVEIDHEMISTVILLPSADLFKKGCCQL